MLTFMEMLEAVRRPPHALHVRQASVSVLPKQVLPPPHLRVSAQLTAMPPLEPMTIPEDALLVLLAVLVLLAALQLAHACVRRTPTAPLTTRHALLAQTILPQLLEPPWDPVTKVAAFAMLTFMEMLEAVRRPPHALHVRQASVSVLPKQVLPPPHLRVSAQLTAMPPLEPMTIPEDALLVLLAVLVLLAALQLAHACVRRTPTAPLTTLHALLVLLTVQVLLAALQLAHACVR